MILTECPFTARLIVLSDGRWVIEVMPGNDDTEAFVAGLAGPLAVHREGGVLTIMTREKVNKCE